MWLISQITHEGGSDQTTKVCSILWIYYYFT